MRATVLLLAALALVSCKPKERGPVPSLKASELLAEYRANEVGADDRYKGKRLRVAGLVASVERSAFGDIVVELDAGDALVRAECNESAKAEVGKLAPKQATLLECTVRGMVLGTPMLGKCDVVKSGKAPATSTSK
jgi:hypothetical protein